MSSVNLHCKWKIISEIGSWKFLKLHFLIYEITTAHISWYLYLVLFCFYFHFIFAKPLFLIDKIFISDPKNLIAMTGSAENSVNGNVVPVTPRAWSSFSYSRAWNSPSYSILGYRHVEVHKLSLYLLGTYHKFPCAIATYSKTSMLRIQIALLRNGNVIILIKFLSLLYQMLSKW